METLLFIGLLIAFTFILRTAFKGPGLGMGGAACHEKREPHKWTWVKHEGNDRLRCAKCGDIFGVDK
jgi:hypothetical protein